ncbi:MAG: hypothetical protein MZV70_35130 [Desulfobacterales bacterium]|nr:hypothetical protein [Desulfobacterales bacterium]
MDVTTGTPGREPGQGADDQLLALRQARKHLDPHPGPPAQGDGAHLRRAPCVHEHGVVRAAAHQGRAGDHDRGFGSAGRYGHGGGHAGLHPAGKPVPEGNDHRGSCRSRGRLPRPRRPRYPLRTPPPGPRARRPSRPAPGLDRAQPPALPRLR